MSVNWGQLQRPFPDHVVQQRVEPLGSSKPGNECGPRSHRFPRVRVREQWADCESCGKRGRVFHYLGWRTLRHRLDTELTPAGWDLDHSVYGATVTARLTIHDGDRRVVRSDGAGVNAPGGRHTHEDAVKTGITEASKRVVQHALGVGSELYWRDLVEGEEADDTRVERDDSQAPPMDDEYDQAPPARERTPAPAPSSNGSGNGGAPKCDTCGERQRPSKNGPGYYCYPCWRKEKESTGAWAERAGDR